MLCGYDRSLFNFFSPSGVQIFWILVVFLIGKLIFKSSKIGFIGVILILGHFILDFFSGHTHHIFGEESHVVGLGLYATNVYLAIGIEAIFSSLMLWYFFKF